MESAPMLREKDLESMPLPFVLRGGLVCAVCVRPKEGVMQHGHLSGAGGETRADGERVGAWQMRRLRGWVCLRIGVPGALRGGRCAPIGGCTLQGQAGRSVRRVVSDCRVPIG